MIEDSEETEDYHVGSHRGRKSERRVTDLDAKRTVKEVSDMKSRVAILQLCGGVTCLVIQLPSLDSMPISLNFLQLPDLAFVGIGIKETLAKLEKEYGLGCNNAVELGPLAAGVMQMPYLAACGVDFLGHMVDSLKLTGVVFSDWGKMRLNKKPIKYAAANPLAYFKIGSKLLSG
ncbi:hypothetical protein QUC31_004972 [Theobroma cacao]|uniref:Polynucleotidyl transferase, putative n=1 Tax=Theobroma cacao TaxID=3641 RepID=A0A061DR95_THECC|nr:Polynucleotidyl transferase, putative [Theobroma cacao]WRX07945.1 hypothetical protein QQP08_000432 [Theobroma cacao]